MGNSVSHIVIMFIMLKFLSVCEGLCCSLASCFVAGYLPLVTTPCQSAPAPASRRVGVCSGNDIPMITELGKLRSHTWQNHTMRAPFAISANEVMFHLSLFVCWFVLVVVWLSGNALVSVNEVTVLRARLVLGMADACPGFNSISVYNQPPRSTQPGHPSLGRRSEYW